MRILMFVLFSVVAWPAMAQLTFTLEPAIAQGGEDVRLRFDSPEGCYPIQWIETAREGDVVIVELSFTDTAPCLPEWRTPRYVPLGRFARGSYEVQVIECGSPPPSGPACLPQATLPLTVVEARRFTIPTLSSSGFAASVLALAMLGWVQLRRH